MSNYKLLTVLVSLSVLFCITIAIITHQKDPFFAGIMIGQVPMTILMWAFDRPVKEKGV